MDNSRPDRLVTAVLLAEFFIIAASLGSVFLYDTWLGAYGFVIGFTLLICAVPILVALESRAVKPEVKAREAFPKAVA